MESNVIVPEWKGFYIKKSVIKRYFKLWSTKFKDLNFSTKEKEILLGYDSKFWLYMETQVAKVDKFMLYIETDIKRKFFELQYILKFSGKLGKKKFQEVRVRALYLYKHCHLAQKYLDLNKYSLKKTTDKLTADYFSPFILDSDNQTRAKILREGISYNMNSINSIRSECFTLYVYQFTSPKNQHAAKGELKEFTDEKASSIKDSFYLGMFIGAIVVLILVFVMFASLGDLGDLMGFKMIAIFHIYRGAFLFSVYYWSLALNVHLWNKRNINYQRVFGFGTHYSCLTAINKRCAFITLIFMICLSAFIIIKITADKNILWWPSYSWLIPSIFMWTVYLIFFFFPSATKFNGKGRIYLYKNIGKSLIFWKYDLDFPILFVTGQILSLVIPLQDFFLGIYFKIHYIFGNRQSVPDDIKLFFSFGVILFPVSLRLIQYFKVFLKEKNFDSIEFVHIFRLGIVLLVVIYSTFMSFQRYLLYAWLTAIVVASALSIMIDFKIGWGVLNMKFLKGKGQYSKLTLYSLILLNIILRISWILTLTNYETRRIPKTFHLLTLILGLLEIFRRFIWTQLRVEKEYYKRFYYKYEALRDFNFEFDYAEDNRVSIINANPPTDPLLKNSTSLGDSFDNELRFDLFAAKIKKREITTALKHVKEFKQSAKAIKTEAKAMKHDFMKISGDALKILKSNKSSTFNLSFLKL